MYTGAAPQAQRAVVSRPRSRRLKRIRRGLILYALIAVPIVWYLVFMYLPMIGIIVAFEDFSLYLGVFKSAWVGWQNFVNVLTDPYFWQVASSTVVLGVLTLLFTFPAPIVLALLFNEMKEGMFKKVAQTISYLPYFVSIVALVNIVTIMLSPSSGIVDGLIQAIGGKPINFLVENSWFRPIYIMILLWATTGWNAIIYLAAITGLDPQLYQAAEIDGAGRLARIRHVTLPGIAPTITILFLLALPSILSTNFEIALLVQQPITFGVSDVVSTYSFRRGILDSDFGYATAVQVLWSVVSLAIIYSANRVARRYGETSLW